MYLSRLILDPRSRSVRRDLADCQALHRTVMGGFPDVPGGGDARVGLGVLYRLDVRPRTGVPTLLVQSQAAPDWSNLAPNYLLETGDRPNPSVKAIAAAYAVLRDGMELIFRLRANPTRRIGNSEPDARWRGKRVELRDEEARLAWLRRKAEQGGFELLAVRATAGYPNGQPVPDVRLIEEPKLAGRRPDAAAVGGRLTFGSVLFEGRLRVSEAALFRRTIEHGIGSGKAYGFGLLSVARATG